MIVITSIGDSDRMLYIATAADNRIALSCDHDAITAETRFGDSFRVLLIDLRGIVSTRADQNDETRKQNQ